MALIVPSRRVWTRQPQQPVGVDWSNPLTRGLVSAYTGIGGDVGVMQTRVGWLAPDARGVYTKSPRVGGIAFVRSSDITSFPLQANASSLTPSAMSRVAVLSVGALSGIQTITGGSVNNGLQFRFNGTQLQLLKQGVVLLASSSTGIPENAYMVVSASIVFGTRYAFYQNGLLWGSGTPAAGTLNASPSLQMLSQLTGIEGATFGLMAHYEFGRELADYEHRAFAWNPWQIFGAQASPAFYSWGEVSASTAPTLSLPGVQSITATSAVPRVTVTFS